MNHLNKQDKFEQKLKEQFDNFEAKPNEALWENIAQNIPSDNFEKKLATKLNTLKYEPNESIWLVIEKRLPFIVQVNKKLIYLWTFVVLSFGVFAGILINKLVSDSKLSDALSHPKAFIWLEGTRNEKIILNNKQWAIKNGQLAIGNKKNTASTLQNESVIMQKVSFHLQKAPVALQYDENNLQNAVSTMQSVSGTAQSGSSNLQKATDNNLYLISKILDNEIVLTKVIKPIPEPTKDSVIEIAPLVKVDSLMVSPKNNTVLAQQVSDENYTGPSLKKEKLSIIAYGGLGYSYMRYAAGNDKGNVTTNQLLREQTESSESEITGGFLIGYDLTKRFTISSGLILANFKQTMNFSKEKAKNPIGNFEENLIYFNDTITTGNTNSANLKYSFTEIPLFITYKAIETQKFELAFQTGLGIGFVTGINTYIINTNNIGVYEVTNKDDYPAFKNTIFFSFQPQFTYNLNSPGVSVGLMPIIKTSLTNIVNDENWLKQYPYNMSVNVFLRKRF